MADSNLIMTLAKVIIAAAWADGEIQHEELNSLKDLLFALPQLTGLQWAELEMYIETPVNDAERAYLLAQLQQTISSAQDQALALQALQNMLQADGTVTTEEQQMAAEIRVAIESADTSTFGRLANLIRGPVARRSQAAANIYNRERYFNDFVKNKIYYNMRRRLDLSQADLDITDLTLRKLGLAGGLLARIAHITDGVVATELEAIIEALQSGWEITHKEAVIVAEVAISAESQNLDYFRVTREFVTLCELEDRKGFVDALFKVAVADGQVSANEMNEIREITRSLKLSSQTFIAAKLKIPREQRLE